MNAVKTFKGKVIEDPKFAKFLTGDWRMSLLWLPIRIWVGYTWIDASLHKISSPAWVVTGDALKGFWAGAVAIPAAPARPVITFEWYRGFLQMMLDAQAYTWFAKVVAYGELVIGIALILGAFTGIAAFFGGFMNWNFIMAGSASSNGLLFAAEVGLILAWKVAGLIGADFFLLRWLGTPWGRKMNEPAKKPAEAAAD
jgi:thiosulfate dehydrogenase [quinone] large subunit